MDILLNDRIHRISVKNSRNRGKNRVNIVVIVYNFIFMAISSPKNYILLIM